MTARIDDEIDRAAFLGQRLEDLVYNKAKDGGIAARTSNDDLLIAYWSLIFDYSKGMLCLLQYKFHSPAFALARPMIEALVRAHLVLFGSDDEVKRIRQDRYKVSYENDGQRIDKALGSSPLFENLLKGSRDLLHSLTHSGKAQLQKRFDGDEVGSGYTDSEIWGLLGTASSAVFMITALITHHYGMEDQFKEARTAWAEFGREREAIRACFLPPVS
jgi:hypothetical protein